MKIRTALVAVASLTTLVGVAHAQFLDKTPVITSVEPLSGSEGTIVTLKGRNFPTNPKNLCVMIGGLGAMACVEPNPTPTELKIKIGPIAKTGTGDILMWAGTALNLYTAKIQREDTYLVFSQTKLFRNGSLGATAGIKFELTEVSPDTYAGYFQDRPTTPVELGGLEDGPVVRTVFPGDLKCAKGTIVDVDFLLKEPTLSIEFSAEISGDLNGEEVLGVIAKSISASATLIGEKVFANVTRNPQTGDLELYVTKPYLGSAKGTIRFRKGDTESVKPRS